MSVAARSHPLRRTVNSLAPCFALPAGNVIIKAKLALCLFENPLKTASLTGAHESLSLPGMPTLDWIGKKAVVNNHKVVPYRLIRCEGGLCAGAVGEGNSLVEGDNWEALKALLPYPYNRKYNGGHVFQKQYYPAIGELQESGEQFDCAVFLDSFPEITWWVRNLAGIGREQTSFWIQTATDKFYPDFVCLLNEGRRPILEYKNATDWSNDDNKQKRAVSELWAERSGRKCLFVMPKGPDFNRIKLAIKI
jgi:hypothetical protein